MSFRYIGVIILLYQCVILTTQDRQPMPQPFKEICHVQSRNNTGGYTLVSVKCTINGYDDQTWRLDTLRDWIITTKSNQSYRFSYDITCDQSGVSVSIPLPMKCPGLVELMVRNCNLTDTFADFENPLITSMPQSLRRLHLIDVSMVIKMSKLLYMFKNIKHITSEFECFHDKFLQDLVFRNVSYIIDNNTIEILQKCVDEYVKSLSPDLTNDTNLPLLGGPSTNVSIPQLHSSSNDSEEDSGNPELDICDMLNTAGIIDVPKRIRDVKVSCDYKELRNLDYSFSDTMSHYNIRFLAKYNKYPKLRSLNYSHTNMVNVPEELWNWGFYFTVMQHIDLSYNHIKSLPFKTLFRPVHQCYFNIQYNNITTLTVSDLDSLKAQSKAFYDIRNNPINCDCDLKDFITALSNGSKIFVGSLKRYAYIQDMACHLPENLRGRTLASLSVEDLHCPSNTWVVPFVILAVISAFLLTIILLGFIYRKELRILFYTRLNIQIPGVVFVDLGPKTYHAFVSYSNEDEDWVLDVLCKQLEEPKFIHPNNLATNSSKRTPKASKQFKLCIHARDFVPGMTIIENIINSVENSRHTVIVLTENFVQSKWAMEEFYQAYNQSVMERRRHLIIIIRGEIPEKISPILKRCLKTFTYLKVSDKLFYDRLTYSLSTENVMTKEESSREEENLKSRKTTVGVDLHQESDSGIFNTSDESLSVLSGRLNTQTSVVSTANSEFGLIEATHL